MRIDFTPDPALYPFTSQWFDSSAGRIHFIDEGSGPPHYIQEDAPDEIADVITKRFG